MRKGTGFLVVILLLVATVDAEARRLGRFVSSFSRGMAHSGLAHKTYSADVLTVTQLTDCLRRADKLDIESEIVEAERTTVGTKFSEIDRDSSALEHKQSTLNRYSQHAVDRFNADIRRHNSKIEEARSLQVIFNQKVSEHNASVNAYNALCAKRYYADDLEAAKLQAGVN